MDICSKSVPTPNLDVTAVMRKDPSGLTCRAAAEDSVPSWAPLPLL